MKKLMLISLTLALMLAASGCLAESIFDPIKDTTVAAPPLTAPSYGAMANVAEDQVEQNAEGGTIVTYRGVDASGYNSFGIYLGGLGFSVTSQEKREGQIAYALTDGQVEFVMIYDQAAHAMQLVYPKGIDFEKSQFPGYIQIVPGKEISIQGLGKFVFNDFIFDGTGYVCGNAAIYDQGGKIYYYDPCPYVGLILLSGGIRLGSASQEKTFTDFSFLLMA